MGRHLNNAPRPSRRAAGPPQMEDERGLEIRPAPLYDEKWRPGDGGAETKERGLGRALRGGER